MGHNQLRCRTLERNAPGQRLKCNNRQRILIATAAQRLLLNLFGRQIFGRAHERASLGQAVGTRAWAKSDAKIGQEDTAIHIDQNIMGLDVAMDRATCVGIMQGIRDRREQGHAQRQTELAPVRDNIVSVQPAMYSIAM